MRVQKAPRAVCVVGMHRSGTSVAARLTSLLGAHLGPAEHLMLPDASNPSGFWENQQLTNLNDALLECLGGSWHEPPELLPGWERRPALDALRERARSLLRADFGEAPLWAWKDPRTSLTLPFWKPLLPPAHYVVCLRNPREVARSLVLRNGFRPAKSGDLWVRYTRSALEHTAQENRVLLFFDDVQRDAAQALQSLARLLGSPAGPELAAAQQAARAFLRVELRHHDESLLANVDDEDLPYPARALFLALRVSHPAPSRGTSDASLDVVVNHFARGSDRAQNQRRAGDAALSRARHALEGEQERRRELQARIDAMAASRARDAAERKRLDRERRALVRGLQERDRALECTRSELQRALDATAELQSSLFWQLLQRYRVLERAVLGGGLRRQLYRRALAGGHRMLAAGTGTPRALDPRPPAARRAEAPALCTVVSKNYLAYARVLARSFLAHHPEGRVFVLLADRVDGHFDPSREPFELLCIEELDNVPDLRHFLFKYDVLELNTAVKPYFFEYLFRRRSLGRLLFLDPDILVLDRLDALWTQLEEATLLLTPHLTEPYADEHHPNEIQILQAGVYNLGFLGLSDSEASRRFLSWWKTRLYDHCALEPEAGMHVDQKWVDFAPLFWDGVRIVRDRRYNVAYWNLHERGRRLRGRGTRLTMDGQPLAFFHFSGIESDRIERVSKHQDRFRLRDFPRLRPLFEAYRDHLRREGIEETRGWEYAFGCFHDGTPIPDPARRLFRQLEKRARRFRDPFDPSGRRSFFAYLREASEEDTGSGTPIPRLWREVHRMRPDLQRAFPDLFGTHREAFLSWVRDGGRRELAVPPSLVPGPTMEAGETRVGARHRTVPARLYRSWIHPREPRLKAVLRRVTRENPRLWRRLRAVRNRMRGSGPLPPPAAPAVSETRRPFGVNLAGYFESEKGVGEGVRAQARCFEAAGIPLALSPAPEPGMERPGESARLDASNPYAINVVHVNADQVPVFAHARGGSFFRGRYNVGYWAWELSEFPEHWMGSFRYFDELWVPSRFVQEALERLSPIPVIRMPHCLTQPLPTGAWTRAHFGLPENSFLFLFAFDLASYLPRKNPLGLIRAFRSAFAPSDPVDLVIKCAHPEFDASAFASLRAAAREAGVRLLDRILSREEMNTLVARCDAYVSLHRSEGFGLTLAEAMALGKPVIATAYSGNTDFMDASNSLPVPYAMTTIDRAVGPYARGGTWAEPDLEAASVAMRRVVQEPELARRLGAQAQIHVRRVLDPATVGARARQRLQAISEARDLPFPAEKRAALDPVAEGAASPPA